MRGVKKVGNWSVRVDHRGLDLVKSLENASPRKWHLSEISKLRRAGNSILERGNSVCKALNHILVRNAFGSKKHKIRKRVV